MILETLEPFRLLITKFLNIIIIDEKFLFFNLWSVIHILAGFYIFKFILKYRDRSLKDNFKMLFLLLILWELFELMMINFNVIYQGLPLFKGETSLDWIYDLILGMIGGGLAWVKKK